MSLFLKHVLRGRELDTEELRFWDVWVVILIGGYVVGGVDGWVDYLE